MLRDELGHILHCLLFCSEAALGSSDGAHFPIILDDIAGYIGALPGLPALINAACSVWTAAGGLLPGFYGLLFPADVAEPGAIRKFCAAIDAICHFFLAFPGNFCYHRNAECPYMLHLTVYLVFCLRFGVATTGALFLLHGD